MYILISIYTKILSIYRNYKLYCHMLNCYTQFIITCVCSRNISVNSKAQLYRISINTEFSKTSQTGFTRFCMWV